LLRKDFKTYFANKLDTLLDISKTYTSVQNKIDFIKLTLEKVKKTEFKRKDEEVSECATRVATYKLLISKYQMLLDLISIPYNMVLCIRNNNLELYLSYLNYINGIGSDCEIISAVGKAANKVNEILCNILHKILVYDSKHDFNLSQIGNVLKIRINPLFEVGVDTADTVKQANVILYQFTLFSGGSFIDFLKIKIKVLTGLLGDEGVYLYKAIRFILNTYVKDHLNINLKGYRDTKQFLFDLFDFINSEIDLARIPELEWFEDTVITRLLTYINELYKNNTTMIKKYLSSIKDLKGLLKAENELVRYELLVILNNNLLEILGQVYSTKVNKIIYKKDIISGLDEHVREVLDMIRLFFEDNYFLFQTPLAGEIDTFKATLCNTLLIIYTDLFKYLNIFRLWQEKQEQYVNIIFTL
jgi:hypothetical protein